MILDKAPVLELLAEEWPARRAAFESSCRSGSNGHTPNPDSVIGELAHAFEEAARRELLAIRDAYFRPSALAVMESEALTMNLVIPDTRNRMQDATPKSETELPTFVLPPAREVNADDVDRTVTLVDPNVMTGTFQLTTQDPRPARLPNVPGYSLLAVLGHGGMGVVYKAQHLALNREVALKMILKGEHASPSAISRFLTEARSVARINHPNIVQIYQIDEHDGLPSFALEFCPGGSLDRKLNKEPLPPLKAAEYAESLAGALQAVHDVGVIHRDIKPSNVLVAADGSLKITDFGLARVAVDDGGEETGSGTILGSPSYMPPEQATGKQDTVGPLSDQYSLGATLYEFLTGSPPFKGPTTLDTIQQVIYKEPVPPSTLQPGVPKDLETICLKALSKDPAKRYASTAAMAEDLKAFREGRPIAARPVGRIEKAWRWAKRNPRVAGLLTAVASLLVVLAVGGAAFTAVYREKAAEAQNNFRESEARGEQLASALKEAETNLKEANENYDLARNVSIALTQRVPGEIRSRVLDPNARLSVVDLIAQTIMDRKPGGSVRQLPDRILYAATLLRGDAALDRGDARAALADYASGTAIAERMVAAEPKEKDKAYGLWAVSLESQASAQLMLAKARTNSPASVEVSKSAAEAGRALAEKAVAAQRQRVASPRSTELPLLERKQNLASALAKLANFVSLQEAETLLEEAIALQNEVMNGEVTEGTQQARLNLANLFHQQSEVFYQQQKRKERGEALTKAIAELTKHQAEVPDNVAVRVTLAQWNRDMGDMIVFDGNRAGAMPFFRTVYELTRPLMTGKKTLLLQEELAADAYRAGIAALEAKDAAAAKHFRSCFRLAEETMESGRVTTQLLNLASLAAARAGESRHAEQYAAKVEQLSKNNISQLMEAACCYATLLGSIDNAPLTATEKAAKKEALTAKVIELISKRLEVLKSPRYAGGLAVNLASFLRRLNTDPDFDGARETAEFKKFVEEAKAIAP